MARNPKAATKPEGVLAIAERLQSILVNAAEGRRSVADDREFPELRRKLARTVPELPNFLQTHPSVDSFSARIKSVRSRTDRVDQIRRQFSALLEIEEEGSGPEIKSSGWTGIEGGIVRVQAVKALLPLAQSAIEGMISALSGPNANGAPLLDQHEYAINNLRELHRTLGALLDATDSGHLDDDLGEGLAAEAGRYAKRAANALSRDPIPYISSALLLGLLNACGVPGIGVFVADIALNIKKNSRSGD